MKDRLPGSRLEQGGRAARPHRSGWGSFVCARRSKHARWSCYRRRVRPLSTPLSDDDALILAELPIEELGGLMDEAAALRDRAWGRRVTYSPKVFLPLTNLCKNRCGYCSFRRSPAQSGAHTMTPDEVIAWLDRGAAEGCVEALFCLGDTPEVAFPAYRETLASFGHRSTVDYLVWGAKKALDRGLLPHTNAGILSREEMARLREVNVSLGLMVENVSPRLCLPGMPHGRAPDKRPLVRLRMLDDAGDLRIAFTTGILVGIGETRRERVESLLAIRRSHRLHGHIQEVIVQNFRAHPGTPMATAKDAEDFEILHAVAMARLVLDEEVSVQAPPNLMQMDGIRPLLRAGINDLGGISPVTPDFINPTYAWPHLDGLASVCAAAGHVLRPRLGIHERFLARGDFLAPRLQEPVRRASACLLNSVNGTRDPRGRNLSTKRAS